MLHFSGAVVALKRALKIAAEFASSVGSRVLESRKSKVTPEIRVWLGPARGGDLRDGVARSGKCIISRHGNARRPEIDVGSFK
jgi:hypothetical protein